MSMQEFRNLKAEGAIDGYLIVKPGASGGVVVAAAATDKLVGTSDSLAKVAGEHVDIGIGHIHEVRLGGTVAAGDALTANAAGKAIATTTVGNRLIGFAEVAGVADDVITYHRALGVL